MPFERPAWLSEELYPFESHTLDLDGHRVHYVDEGEGPTLLFLHGNPTWSFLYRDVIKNLRDSFRCVAPDYPGFGLSTAVEGYGFTPAEHARVIEQFLLMLDLNDVTLMGQDYGGPIGLGVVGRHPDRFQGLVLANTFAWPMNGRLDMQLFSRLLGGPIGEFLIRRFNAFVDLLIPFGVCRRQLTSEIMAAYRGPFPTPASRYPIYVFPRELRHSRDYFLSVAYSLPRLREMPALLVWGDADPALRADVERVRFQLYFPRHTTVLLNNTGHFIQEDAPGVLAKAIRRWWNGQIHAA
jgi:haloalkane dehalogenase